MGIFIFICMWFHPQQLLLLLHVFVITITLVLHDAEHQAQRHLEHQHKHGELPYKAVWLYDNDLPFVSTCVPMVNMVDSDPLRITGLTVITSIILTVAVLQITHQLSERFPCLCLCCRFLSQPERMCPRSVHPCQTLQCWRRWEDDESFVRFT